MVRWPAYWLVGCLVGWLVSCLSVDWFVGLLVGRLVGWLAGPLNLRRSLACELTAHLIRAWLAFEPLWRNIFYRDFQLQGILFKKWSWARFFRRPLYQCDFEICSTTPQLDPNRKPIWFCKCKLRYTVWVILESQLHHIQFWTILKQLFVFLPPSLPPFTIKAQLVSWPASFALLWLALLGCLHDC